MNDLAALNSATKYPSIPTYHALGERGVLTETATAFTGEVILTEKVDGTSSRVVFTPDGDWFIGSREELLTARGDRIANPALGIVEALRPLAERLVGNPAATNQFTVFFLETFGGKIGGQARQYTGAGEVGFRLFDLAYIPTAILDLPRAVIAEWRDGAGQAFCTEPTLRRAAAAEGVELTPRLATIPADALPATVEDTHTWLTETLPATLVALDEGAGGRAEGIVLRTADRSVIAKARFEDYARTLRHRTRNAGSALAAGSR